MPKLPLQEPGKGKNIITEDDGSDVSPIYQPVYKEMINMAGMIAEFLNF